jgi:hypothetical protein
MQTELPIETNKSGAVGSAHFVQPDHFVDRSARNGRLSLAVVAPR